MKSAKSEVRRNRGASGHGNTIGRDNRAVTVSLDYIMISGVSIIFFLAVTMVAGTMLLDRPTNIAATQQFNDIGNDIGTKLTMFYLIVPASGALNTSLEMPSTIGGHAYTIRMSTENTTDQRVIIESEDLKINVSYTINGIGASIPINGEAYSTSGDQRLTFVST